MTTKSDFSTFEWQLLKDSPYWVQTAITQAEGRMGLIEKRREAKALEEFLGSYKSADPLVNAVLAEAKDGKHDVNPDTPLEKVGATLEQIADVVEKKADRKTFDAFGEFLVAAGTAIAEATAENMLKKDQLVSDQEAEALDLIARALRATDADKAKRAADEAARQRAELQKQQETAKKAQEAKAQAEAQKKLEETQRRLKEAEEEAKKREEEAKRQEALREERRKRMEEARAKAAAAQEAARQKAAEKAEAAQTVHEVQPGDTLSHIALKYYGNANAWRQIYEANKDAIKNPSLIYPGQKFVIPPQQ